MFHKKIAFVMGAGASMPYGFPSGAGLVEKIIESLVPDQKDTVNLLTQICTASDDPKEERILIEEFRKTLAESREQSIDTFLQHRMHFEEQGKRTIAAMILTYEKKASLFPAGSQKQMDWYPLMLQMLNSSFNDFDGNSVSFITYNYDRSLEELLYTSLKSRERNDHSKADWAKRIQQCIPIVHLHGQVGQHEAFAEDSDKVVKYGDSWLADNIRKASKEIRIVYEKDIEQARGSQGTYNLQFAKAWQLLNDAEVICFLGFGFHPLNLKRLRIERWNGLKIGTAYGMTIAQKERIARASNGRIMLENLGDDKSDCLKFMNESRQVHQTWVEYHDDHPRSR